jgi:PD-(D/E)XK nuclease superfamily
VKVRQSTLGDADKCLRSLQYSLEHPVYHGGITRAIGTAYHAALEWAYLAEIQNGVWPDYRMAIIEAYERLQASIDMVPSHESEKTKRPGQFKWTNDIPDFETASRILDVMIKAYWDEPDAHWDREQGWQVLAVEQGFSIPLWNGHTGNGSIDLTVQDPQGFICGEDHKTAGKNKWPYNKHHARKQNQAPWYVMALHDMYPDAPGYRFFFDIMTHKGVWERRETIVTQAHIDAVREKALQVVTLYEGMRGGGLELPANPSSNLCSPDYCDHWDVCPYGAALDLQ